MSQHDFTAELDQLEHDFEYTSHSPESVDAALDALEKEFSEMEMEIADDDDTHAVGRSTKSLTAELVRTLEHAATLVDTLKALPTKDGTDSNHVIATSAEQCAGVAKELSRLSTVVDSVATKLRQGTSTS